MQKIARNTKALIASCTALFFLNFSPISDLQFPKSNSHLPTYEIQKPKEITGPNSYLIQINLPEFKSRLYENNDLIDSAVISPGAYSRRTPLIRTSTNSITVRPSFYPPPRLRSKFSANPPDKTDPPQNPKNALGRFRIVLDGLYRMHGTSLLTSIGRFGSNGHVIDGQFRSNGCIRHDNFDGERIISRIIQGSKVQKISGRLKDSMHTIVSKLKDTSIHVQDFIYHTPNSQMHTLHFENKINLCVIYRAWNKKMTFDGSALHMTIYRDIYNYVQGRTSFTYSSSQKNSDLNAFDISHFKKDLLSNQIFLSDNQINHFYSNLQKQILHNKIPGRKIKISYEQNHTQEL